MRWVDVAINVAILAVAIILAVAAAPLLLVLAVGLAGGGQ